MPDKNKQKKVIAKQESFEPRKIKARVIGIGGGGCSMALEMAKKVKGVSFVLSDTDSRVFKRFAKSGAKVSFFKFGEGLLGGMGSGGNVELAKQAALAEKEKIAKLFYGYDLVVLLSALGGGVGCGCLPIFAQTANSQKTLTLGFFTLPFEFEGEKKMALAKKTYCLSKKELSGALCVANEKIFKLVDKKTPLKKALSALNNEFALWLCSLLDIILKPGLINIDFADLRTILKDRDQEIYFAKTESCKENKAEEVLKKALDQPLFGKPPLGFNKILYCLSVSKNTALSDVEKVSNGIYSLNPKARIIFGLNQLNSNVGKLEMALLAVGAGGRETNNIKLIANSKKTNNKKQKQIQASRAAALRQAQGKTLTRARSARGRADLGLRGRDAKKARPRGRDIVLKDVALERKNALEVKKTKEEETQEEWAKIEREQNNGQNWQIPAFLRKS